jgi:hypothetical protein
MATNGFSIIGVQTNKIPIGSWKKYQTSQRSSEEVSKIDAPMFGYCTGYNGFEVIDIDLKVFSSLHERKDFWNEYISFLKDNIDDFDNKFVIYKTMNHGYHIIYRTESPKGNSKIARLKDKKEYIIESRGIGGYCVVYPPENKLSKLSYLDTKVINEEDLNILWSCSKYYHYQEEVIQISNEVKKEFNFTEKEVTPWEDYNSKNEIWDLIQHEFIKVRNLSDKWIIKRHGASSPHSGYIYKDSGCLFLFSTGTNYPSEKLLNPFSVYTYQNHRGDFKLSASEIYKQGYGTRKIVKPPVIDIRELPKNLDFPIEIFPKEVQDYLIESNDKLLTNIDYMACSLLWSISLMIGNTIRVKAKNGWIEPPCLWITLVGRAGVGKTPSINSIVKPLSSLNLNEIERQQKNENEYEEYSNLDKKEKKDYGKVVKPKKSQFIVKDITLEALVELHQDNDISVGVLKDELAGWIKDMNKYRAGSDLEFWLSAWNSEPISLNRKTAKSSFVASPFIPVLGGIQPSVMNSLFSEDYKNNGFLDRMLFCYPEIEVEKWNPNNINEEYLLWFSNIITNFFNELRSNVTRWDDSGKVKYDIAELTKEAEKEQIRIHDKFTDIQNSDNHDEYLKSIYPKQKNYLFRFALIIHVFDSFILDKDYLLISKESILKAEKLCDYFIKMATKVKLLKEESSELGAIIKKNRDSKNNKEIIKLINESNPNFNKKELASLLHVSRQYIYNSIKND